MRERIFSAMLFLVGMIGVVALIGVFLCSSVVIADDSSISTMTLTVPVACSMSGVVNAEHSADLLPGVDSRSADYFPNGIGQTTLTIRCNDAGGFAIYAVGYSEDAIGNTYLHDDLEGQVHINDIQTGTSFSGGNSAWAMKLGIASDSGDTSGTNAFILDSDTEGSFGNYHTVPNSFKKVAHKNTSTDMRQTGGGVSLTTTYAAYIGAAQRNGAFVGKVKYTMVHPASELPAQPVACEAAKICYNANNSSAQGTMGQQFQDDDSYNITDGSTVTLLASNFSRDGYGFAGWNTSYDYTGFNYGPQETITVPSGTYINGLALYAHWVRSAGVIQNWTGCSGLQQGSVTALTDQRDNQTYAVAKLADGKCWMIENLRLENTNSDNSTGLLAQGYGASSVYGNFSGLATAELSFYSDVNSLYYSGIQSGVASVDIGVTDFPSSRMPRYNNINTSNRALSPSTSNGSIYSYGNYYTWSAAIANTTYYNTNNQSITTTSLCPAGWRLPRGGDKSNESNNDFWSLIVDGINNGTNPTNYGDDNYPSYNTDEGDDVIGVISSLRAYPNNFIDSGRVVLDITSRGKVGSYWSSSVDDFNRAYSLLFDSEAVYPGTFFNDKIRGLSVRCMTGS